MFFIIIAFRNFSLYVKASLRLPYFQTASLRNVATNTMKQLSERNFRNVFRHNCRASVSLR